MFSERWLKMCAIILALIFVVAIEKRMLANVVDQIMRQQR